MTPRTPAQNLLLYGGAVALAVLIAFLTALAKQLPGDAPLVWRPIWLDVILSLLQILPAIGIAMGLPRFGKENIASLVSEVGAPKAQAALEVEAIKQQTGVTGAVVLSDEDVDRIARRGLTVMHDEEARLDDERKAQDRG